MSAVRILRARGRRRRRRAAGRRPDGLRPADGARAIWSSSPVSAPTSVSPGRGSARRARAGRPTGSSRAVPTTCDDECGGCQLQHLDGGRAAGGAARLRRRRAPAARPAGRARSRRSCRRPGASTTAPRSRSHVDARAGTHRPASAMIAPSRSSICERCHITVPELDGAVAGAPAAAPAASRRACRPLMLRLDRTGGLPRRVSVRPGRGAGRRRPTLRDALAGRGRRGDDLVAGGGRRAARRGGRRTSRSPPRCSSRCIPRWATGSGPSPWRRWGPRPTAWCGTSTPASARPRPRWRRPEPGRERRVRPARRRRGGSPAGPRPAAPPAGSRTCSAARGAGPRRHQSSPRRHGRRRSPPSWSGGGRSGSSTSRAIPRPSPGTSRG